MRIEDCPVKTAIDVIGGKWKPLILFALKDQTLRFEQLRRHVRGATQKVLTEQLRQLEASAIVQRTVVAGSQPHVEYSLTVYGETLRPALLALAEWGARHRQRTRAA
ncbi:MAG: helix-turn-helix transcriptional regulator [Bryobacteraceae bacterium]|nr:helix-turn-helix transcriptional regulator [Bryobacteraceae bacterium]